jgi:tRNA 2-thiocytidine biosynthesis protein TtcA
MSGGSVPDEVRERARLEKRLAHAMGRAIMDFAMIESGDRVMVALSGGKDSFTLHFLLASLARRAPVPFSVVGVHLDQGQPGHRPGLLADYMRACGHEFHLVREDTYSIVRQKIPEGRSYCSLCSRLRRAILYRAATELRCTKIALGHHRDDAIATLLLNLFFSGQLKSMPPKLRSDDGAHVVIRPLAYCDEKVIARFAVLQGFPVQPCSLCGSQEDSQRKAVGELVAKLEQTHPGVRENAAAALANVRPTHLWDAELWGKLGLHVGRARQDAECDWGSGAEPDREAAQLGPDRELGPVRGSNEPQS